MTNIGREGTGVGRRGPTLGADFPVRAAAGVVLMALALGIAWVGGFPFLVLWLLAGLGVVWEWQRLVGGAREWERIGVSAVTLLLASPFALHSSGLRAGLVILLGAVVAGAIAEPARRIWSGAGVVYAGALVVGVNLLRASPQYGLAAILWLFAVVWGTDVMAYIGGRLTGGPKLWPSVSPGKTWSGALVGAASSALLGAAFAWLFAPPPLKLGPIAALSLVISVAAQAGDLFESAMKRRAGVKDSSHLIPGHGGLMDRLDGFIIAAAIATAVAQARSPGEWIAPGLFQW